MDQVYIDSKLLDTHDIKGCIQSDKQPILFKDYLADDDCTYYYVDDNGQRVYVHDHEIYVYHGEYFMALSGEWVMLSVLDYIEKD